MKKLDYKKTSNKNTKKIDELTFDNLYYKNIFENDAEKIEETINKTILPYKKFIEASIKKAKKKNNIKVKWQKIGGDLIKLIPNDNKKMYKIDLWTEIEILKDNKNDAWFELLDYNEDFDIKKILKNNINIRNKNYKIKTKIIEINEKKVKFDLTTEEVNSIDIHKEFNVEDEDFGEAKLKPLWEKNNIKNIGELYQDSEILDYKAINNKKIKIKNLNINKPIRDKKNNIIKFNILNPEFNLDDDSTILNFNNNNYVFSDIKLSNKENISYVEDYPEEIINNLLYEGTEEKFEFINIENINKLEFIVENSENIKDKKLIYKEIEFRVEVFKNNKDNQYRIQLLDDEDDNDDGIIKKSNLDYFFEDNVEIFCLNKEKEIKYQIKKGSANLYEYSFILTLKGDKTNKAIFPDKEELNLKISTYQLEKQYEALSSLIEKPMSEQKKILKMFIDLKSVKWNNFKVDKLSENDWKVLTDSTRDGTLEQRKFVEKALSTEDFVILEGPPGSGKTTAILELICQLTAKGNKVLLCGSTHVAIDNVLERLKENNLLEKILAVRIGDENKIAEDVKEFQINNIDIDYKFKNIFLESCNLVCGTTMGILQHPIFRNNNNKTYVREINCPINKSSIKPIYDYLIIDESSKTTFSEFLVPAMFAKKWILIGDVKQLSPYTDREEIVSSINTFLNRDKREILYLLYLFCMENKENKDKISKNKLTKFLIPLSKLEMNELLEEISIKNESNKKYIGKFLVLSNTEKQYEIKNKHFELETIKDAKSKAIYFNYEYQGIFIDNEFLSELENYISEDFLFIRNNKIQNYTFNFKQNYKKVDRGDIDKYNKILMEKNWGEEIAWRLIREFELNNTKSQGKYLKKQLNDLYPMEKGKLIEKLFSLKTVAMPSVLEGFQRGIGRLEEHHLATSYTEGFEKIKKFNLSNRYERLSYQHRMHPDISIIPRELFYENTSLQDAKYIKREWNYKRYKKRSIWIDHNKNANRNTNEKEVSIIKEELEHFYNWKQNTKNKDIMNIAILSFYKGQEKKLREMLRDFCSKKSESNQKNKMSQFYLENNGNKIVDIKLYTVDKFQGQEADIVFLSLVNTNRVGFLDNPNRLNVAITRARYQMVYVGNKKYFMEQKQSNDLQKIAMETDKMGR